MSTVVHLAGSALRHRSRAALVGVVSVVALASMAVVTGLQVGRGSAQRIDALATEANVADLAILAPHASTLSEIADLPEIDHTAGPWAVGFPSLRRADGAVTIRVTAIGTTPSDIARPLLRAGRWLDRPGEIVLDRSTAIEYGASLGSSVVLDGVAGTMELTVVGLTIDLTDCAVPQCTPGRGFVTGDDLAQVAGAQQWWTLLATVDDQADPELIAAELDQRFGARLSGINTWPDTRADFLTIDRVFSAFLAGFGGFLLLATAVVLAGSTSARMLQRRREVGIAKTIGATGRQLVAAFLSEQLMLAAAGVLLGWVAGSVLAPRLQVGLSGAVGRSAVRFVPWQLGLAATVVLTVVAVATAVPAARAARLTAVKALRDDASPSGPLARAAGRLPTPNLALGLANLAARPLRTTFAVLATMVAVVGTLVAAAFLATMSAVTAEPGLSGDPWDVSVVASAGHGGAIEAVLESDPAVGAWFTEYSEQATIGTTAVLARGVGGPLDGARYAIGGGRPIAATNEAIVGHRLLGSLDIKVGDPITVMRAGTTLDLTVVGWYRETEESGAVVVHRLEALAQAGVSVDPNVWLVLGKPGSDRGELVRSLTRQLGSQAGVREIEIDTDLGAFRIAMIVIAALVIAVAAMHLAATWLTSGRERARELGILRTLGCSDRALLAQHAIAGAAVATMACVLGTPVGVVVNRVLGDQVTTSIGAGPGLTSRPSATAIGATALVAIVVAALLAAAIARRLIAVPTPTLVRYE